VNLEMDNLNLKEKFLLAKKIGMTQIFIDDKTVPVTVLQALKAKILKLKSKEKDGYNAVVVEYEDKNGKKKTKLKEFRVNSIENFKENQEINVDILEKGEFVNLRSKRKAKGFSGVVKRHGFKGGPRSHGQKNKERAPGSIGQRWPQRVRKGLKMAGKISPKKVTVKNLKIVDILPEKSLILVKGSVPGPNKSLVEVRSNFLTNQGNIYLNRKIKKTLKITNNQS
jgi:large subunit ribosomal protein L3